MERTRRLKRAALIAVIGNGMLAAMKIVAGIASGSYAVVGDGVDTVTDIISAFITLMAAFIISKPPDREHPYGHLRAEVLATKVVSFLIFFVGAQLAVVSTRAMILDEHIGVPSPLAIYVTVVSIAGKIILTISQLRVGRKYDSSMIIANAKNMRNDIVISSSVLVGLFVTRLFDLPLVDSVMAVAVSIWVMKTAVQIFLDSSVEVMEGVRDNTIYDRLFDAVALVEGASNPHRTRIRHLGHAYVIDMDIEVDPHITVCEGHDIAMRIENTIRRRIPNVYDIIVHVEPRGNVESEQYGRSDAVER